MERQQFAYLLLVLMLLAIAALIAYARYNTEERRFLRRRAIEKAARERHRAARGG